MSNDNSFGFSREIPEDIRDIFMWLCQDVASLRQKWDFYIDLFSGEASTSLLSEVARGSFRIIEESLRRDMKMAICRLSDPIQSSGQDNLSLNILIEKLEEARKPRNLLREFLGACEPIRTLRNKRIGHTDLNTRIKPEEFPLPGVGRAQIDQVVTLAERILNQVFQGFVDGELSFKTIYAGGADSLIYWLRKGRESEDTKKKSLWNRAT